MNKLICFVAFIGRSSQRLCLLTQIIHLDASFLTSVFIIGRGLDKLSPHILESLYGLIIEKSRCGLLPKQNRAEGFAGILIGQIVQIGLVLSGNGVEVRHRLTQQATVGVDLLLETACPRLVVSVTPGCVNFCHRVLQGGCKPAKGLRHDLHGAAIHGLHAGLDNVHGVLPLDLTL